MSGESKKATSPRKGLGATSLKVKPGLKKSTFKKLTSPASPKKAATKIRSPKKSLASKKPTIKAAKAASKKIATRSK